MINVKKDFKAKGNGRTDDSPAIRKAIETANQTGGDTVFFPKGNYFLERPISFKNLQHIKLQGEEAAILCKGSQNIEGVMGTGGGFEFSGSYLTIENLKFEGHIITDYRTDYGFGRLLRLRGNNHTVEKCYFLGGNAGGVEITGGNNIAIAKNTFEKCNNYPSKPYTGDYGAIHLVGNCKKITIAENKIFGHNFSGISGYGTGKAGGQSEIFIRNNYIKSTSTDRKTGRSMGIYLLNGANQQIEITGNTIENAAAECIVIFSKSAYPAKNCKIIHNVLYNAAYQGLALRSHDEGGTFDNITIVGNFIENDLTTATYHHQIFLERVENSIITNNVLKGYSKENGAGIFFNFPPKNNIIANNIIENNALGIAFYGESSVLDNNTILNCKTGIRAAYCAGSEITNNLVNNCETPIEYVTQKRQLRLSGNNF